MLADLRALIPSLTQAAVLARAGGEPSYDLSTTGAADNVRELGGRAQQAGRSARGRAQGSGRAAAGRARQAGRGAAQRARTVPGEQAVEGEVRGATAGGDDLPIANYDDLNAGQIVSRLSDLSQLELRTVAAYERRHRNRRTILSRLENLQADEPWAGYDELTAEQVTQRLGDADEATAGRVREYEGRHQRRVSILEAAQRRLARA